MRRAGLSSANCSCFQIIHPVLLCFQSGRLVTTDTIRFPVRVELVIGALNNCCYFDILLLLVLVIMYLFVCLLFQGGNWSV